MTDMPFPTALRVGAWSGSETAIAFWGCFAVAVSTFVLLTLPLETRDVVFVAGAGFLTILALADFASAWASFVLVLPFVHLLGSLCGIAQFTFVRLALVGFICALPFSNLRKVPRALFHELGFIAFFLFIVANLASAVRVADFAAVLRALAYGEPLLFCLLTYCVVRRSPFHFRNLVRAVVVGGIVVAALAIVEIVTQQSVFGTFGIRLPGVLEDPRTYLEQDRFGLGGRVMSTMVQPVYAATYFAVWLIMTVFYFLTVQPRRWRGWVLLLAPVGLVVLVATGSRGPLLAVVPAVLVVALFGGRRPSVSVTMVTAIVSVGLLLVTFVPRLIPTMQASLAFDSFSAENGNVLGRIDVTNRLLDYFQLSPIWGLGPGVIQHQALDGTTEFVGLGGQENQYAIVLADGGAIAGAAYLLFVITALGSMMKAAGHPDRALRNAGLMTLALFVFYFGAVTTLTCLTQVPNYLIMIAYGGIVGLRDSTDAEVTSG